MSQAVAHVLGDVAKLRYLAFSHVEGDESGALNDFLAAAPRAVPVCSNIAAMVQVNDLADRPPRGMADGEELVQGDRDGRRLRRRAEPAELRVLGRAVAECAVTARGIRT